MSNSFYKLLDLISKDGKLRFFFSEYAIWLNKINDIELMDNQWSQTIYVQIKGRNVVQ